MFARTVCHRYFHVTSRNRSVRVRFAPSPTGYIHLGGLRTALYNYLFAKSNNGKFILRIEDTDQKRLVEGAATQLENDLNWMGLILDESPLKGGSYGPYTQSQRLPLYAKYIDELLKTEHAYHCFCTERRLDLIRKEAMRQGSIPRYDNNCRSLSASQVEQKKRQGLPYCIRFKIEPLQEPIHDTIYGDIDRNALLHEGDPVIMKQDNYPTYHLANVIDDHLMEITHVLRGTEWLVSTPKHVLMYKAFGWTPPSFAHLPLIMNSDGTKLSKRQDDIRLEYFRSKGYFPEAISALLCLVGGGFHQSADIQQTLHPLNELAISFNLGGITTHSGRLDMVRLEQFNRQALHKRMQDQNNAKALAKKLHHLVTEKFVESRDPEMLLEDNLSKVLNWASDEGRIYLLNQLVETEMGFLWTSQQGKISTNLPRRSAESFLAKFIEYLEGKSILTRKEITATLRSMATDSSLKVSDVMKLMRSSLTGLKEGPSIGEVMEILGPAICIRRLKSSLSLLHDSQKILSKSE